MDKTGEADKWHFSVTSESNSKRHLNFYGKTFQNENCEFSSFKSTLAYSSFNISSEVSKVSVFIARYVAIRKRRTFALGTQKTLILKRSILLFPIVILQYHLKNHLLQQALHAPHFAVPLKSIMCAIWKDPLELHLDHIVSHNSVGEFLAWSLCPCYTHLVNPITIKPKGPPFSMLTLWSQR